MDICRWLCYITVSCVIIQNLEAKTVSLNELLAAESQDKPTAVKLQSRFEEETYQPDLDRKRISLNKIISEEPQKKQGPGENSTPKFKGFAKRLSLFERLSTNPKLKRLKPDKIISDDKKISPLKYRKTFQIKSPLKPAKLKFTPGLRYKRKNQAIKREINGNEKLKHKYIPLLKSLSMLFDNLLNSDTSNSYEIKTKKYKRNRFYSGERFENSWEYSDGSSFRATQSRSQKTTTTPSSPLSAEISSETEDLTASKNHDHGSVRSNKSIPVLLPRNSFGLRRNNNGISERSGATFHRHVERNITGNHGNHEHNTGCGQNESCAKSNEKITHSITRSDASSIGHSRTDGIRNNTRNSKDREASTIRASKNEDTNDTSGKIQFETRRNETKGEKLLRQPVRGLRGYSSENEITRNKRLPELLQPKEVREEGGISTTNNSTGDKRIVDKNGPNTTEDEKVRSRNETVIVFERNSRSSKDLKYSAKKSPVVMIFDGYSVTRDKNGENKVSGKTIHIHT